MIYSPRAQPEVNKSHINEVPQNNRLIFHMARYHMGEVYMFLFVVLTHVH